MEITDYYGDSFQKKAHFTFSVMESDYKKRIETPNVYQFGYNIGR